MGKGKVHSSNRQSPEKTAAILSGAMQAFLAGGYAATSMDQVASAAGVSKATVYSHFQDKESLFIALVEQLAQEKFKGAFNSPDPQLLDKEPQIALRCLAMNLLDNREPQLLDFIRIIIGESGRFPELARAFVCHIEKPVHEEVREYLTSRTELNLPDPDSVAQIIIGAIIHFSIIHHVLHSNDILPVERDRLIDNLIQLVTSQTRTSKARLPKD
jgi:TetR/AcrR family transcriptional regulator, regulator of autoinduction and epiphytic fitness